jgi:hypothetical protein
MKIVDDAGKLPVDDFDDLLSMTLVSCWWRWRVASGKHLVNYANVLSVDDVGNIRYL